VEKIENIISSKKFLIIAFGALLLVFAFAGCVTLAAVGYTTFFAPREPISTNQFVAVAEFLSFDVRETQIGEHEHLTESRVIDSFTASRGTALVVFSTCTNENGARFTFDAYSNKIEGMFGSQNIRSERVVDALSWNHHSRRSPAALVVTTRIDNTVIFASAETAEDVALIEELIAIIGY